MEVDIFIPCHISELYPDIGFSMVKILEKLSVKCFYNANQSCCGQLCFNTGFWDETKNLGEKFIKDFSRGRMVVSPSASCVEMVNQNYPLMFKNSSLHNELRTLQSNIFEITDFLVHKMNVSKLGAIFPHKVTIHDSCSRKINSLEEDNLRFLLKHVKGIEVVEMPESTSCCGFGGSFSIHNESVSVSLAQQKVENALSTGAEFIVCTETTCMMHLQSYINKNNLPIKTIHITDVLAAGWEE